MNFTHLHRIYLNLYANGFSAGWLDSCAGVIVNNRKAIFNAMGTERLWALELNEHCERNSRTHYLLVSVLAIAFVSVVAANMNLRVISGTAQAYTSSHRRSMPFSCSEM